MLDMGRTPASGASTSGTSYEIVSFTTHVVAEVRLNRIWPRLATSNAVPIVLEPGTDLQWIYHARHETVSALPSLSQPRSIYILEHPLL